jgi:hypothetical protein
MSVQLSRFRDGSFVLHRVSAGDHRYSVWYDRSGRLLDCERTTNHEARAVPAGHVHVRAELEWFGQRYVQA